ncbi:tetratricopeptide repeat protein [Moorena sp. SIO3B2]|uniref:tetratricopeptide repeat protein n=1 Tax=Moorena sp. SIO3B2 TaxID=2607827 RepID=UPI00257CBEDB|nr:tetratricopeptide repeat protein [Moorena sp. SIO3B2]
MDEISETPTSANPSSQDYRQFLIEVLLAIAHSNGNPKVVYPLLQANLDKLDHNFIHTLQAWASAKFSEAEPETAERIARNIGNFSNLIKNFPLGNKANNIEIAMAGYEQLLTVFTRESNREIWAAIQTNLGNAYCQRIGHNRAENLEKAIEAYQLALSVYTKQDLPIEWAMTQNNLGIAYRERICGDKIENLELAIEAYELALSVHTKSDFPIQWTRNQNNLGAA